MLKRGGGLGEQQEGWLLVQSVGVQAGEEEEEEESGCECSGGTGMVDTQLC